MQPIGTSVVQGGGVSPYRRRKSEDSGRVTGGSGPSSPQTSRQPRYTRRRSEDETVSSWKRDDSLYWDGARGGIARVDERPRETDKDRDRDRNMTSPYVPRKNRSRNGSIESLNYDPNLISNPPTFPNSTSPLSNAPDQQYYTNQLDNLDKSSLEQILLSTDSNSQVNVDSVRRKYAGLRKPIEDAVRGKKGK